MKKAYTRTTLLLLLFISVQALAQSDCTTAVQICDNSQLTFDPSGIGPIDDFSNSSNLSGCLLSQEDNSQWLQITFDASMPPNSVFEFTATSVGTAVDTDMAIWGPNPNCGSLGSPILCNFSGSDIAGLSNTGAGIKPMPGQQVIILQQQ